MTIEREKNEREKKKKLRKKRTRDVALKFIHRPKTLRISVSASVPGRFWR